MVPSNRPAKRLGERSERRSKKGGIELPRMYLIADGTTQISERAETARLSEYMPDPQNMEPFDAEAAGDEVLE